MVLRALLGPTLEETRATAMSLGHPRNDTLAEWMTGSPSHSGVLVNQHSAMTISAFYRAVSLISGCVAKIPIDVMRDKGKDVHEREEGHRLEYTLNVRPNEEMDAKTYRELMMSWTLTGGTGPSEIVFRGSRSPELWPITPNRVRPKRVNNRLLYDITNEDGGQLTTVPFGKLLTIIGPSPDGVTGYSVIRVARETLGLNIAAQRYGAGFFGNGAIPKGIFQYEGRMDESAERHYRQMINETHQGVHNSNKFAILRAGWKYQAISIPPDDAQFLETQKAGVNDIARFFGIPPHLLGDLDRATNNNIEHQSLEFLLYCLDYWLCTWEDRLRFFLLTDDEIKAGFYLKHRRRELMAMDSKSRAESNREAIAAGYRSVNEAKRLEGENPIGLEGDLYRFPMAERTAKMALAEQEKPPEEADDGKNKEPQPSESLDEAAQQGKTAQTGLQGQQITALQSILDAISTKKLAKKAGKSLIRVSFPLIDDPDVNEMVDSLEIREPEPVQPVVAPQNASPKPVSAPQKSERSLEIEAEERVLKELRIRSAKQHCIELGAGELRSFAKTKEKNQLRRASKSPESLPSTMVKFYEEQQEPLAASIAHAVKGAIELEFDPGITITPVAYGQFVASQYIERSVAKINEAQLKNERMNEEVATALIDSWEHIVEFVMPTLKEAQEAHIGKEIASV